MALIITRALYGLKTSAKAWSEFFGKSTKPAVNKAGYTYRSYMLVYVDDCLSVNHDSGAVMEDLKSCYKLKGDTCGEPERYLGANVGKYQLSHNGRKLYWSMHAGDYLTKSCKVVRD